MPHDRHRCSLPDPLPPGAAQVLYRLALAERLKAPWRRPGKRPDPVTAAAREAARLQQQQDGPAAVAAAAGGPKAAAAPAAVSGPAGLGFTVKIMLIGVQGECRWWGVAGGGTGGKGAGLLEVGGHGSYWACGCVGCVCVWGGGAVVYASPTWVACVCTLGGGGGCVPAAHTRGHPGCGG